jgi:hypothetical protein
MVGAQSERDTRDRAHEQECSVGVPRSDATAWRALVQDETGTLPSAVRVRIVGRAASLSATLGRAGTRQRSAAFIASRQHVRHGGRHGSADASPAEVVLRQRGRSRQPRSTRSAVGRGWRRPLHSLNLLGVRLFFLPHSSEPHDAEKLENGGGPVVRTTERRVCAREHGSQCRQALSRLSWRVVIE